MNTFGDLPVELRDVVYRKSIAMRNADAERAIVDKLTEIFSQIRTAERPDKRASLVYGHEIKLVSVRTTAYTINYKNGGLSTTIKRKCAFRINDDHFDMRHHVVATPLGHLAEPAWELFQGMMVENVIYKRNDPAMSLVHLGMSNAYHITNKSGCLRGHVKTATDEEVYRLMVKKPKNAEKGYPHKPGYILMA